MMNIIRFVFFLSFICFSTTLAALSTQQSMGASSLPSAKVDKDAQNHTEEEFVEKLLKAYEVDLSVFSKKIYSDISNEEGEKYKRTTGLEFKLIYNQDIYNEGIPNLYPNPFPKHVVAKKGNPVVLADGTPRGIPVGYKLYLPKGEIKAIFISVYGGFEVKDRTKEKLAPRLDNLENYLVSKGIAVIQLNLINFLELKVFQFEMPKDLHAKLHESINYFFKTLKDKPTALHEDLKILEGKQIYLYGASFGGRTAVRHAELYPGTFAGYISHDGTLSFGMMLKSDL